MNRFFALFLVVAAVAAYDKDGDVLVLHDSDIADAIKENEFILIEFYAPWCGHCKNLEPEYSKAATKLAALDTPIPIAKVDATEETEAAGKYGVRGYPTIKWFVNGQDTEYTGGRTEAEIVNWVKKKTGPPCKPLDGKDALEAFKDGADVTVVGFVAADSDDFKTLEAAARAIEDVEIAVSNDADLAKEFGASLPGLVLFKNFDEGKNVYSGDFESEGLQEFIKGNSLPLISTFSQESAPKLFGSGIESHFLYFNKADADSHDAHMDAIRPAAEEFKGKTLFVFVPESESRVLQYFDLSADDLPAAVLVSMGEGDMKKFALPEAITTSSVKAHVAAFHAGELKPTLKSEEIPEDNDGPVKVIVGKNFESIVMDDSKDALVEFYAPWCGHCKALAPTWEELGEKFADNKNIVIGKVDSTANDIDHPKVSIKGFPTILFFPAGAKDSPQTYEGGRDLDSFVEFLEKHTSAKAGSGAGHTHDDL